MRYLLAFDGGQTSTLCLVADETGTVLGIGRAGPSNHLDEPGGEERFQQAVRQSAAQALAMAGLAPTAVAVAVLGMTGARPRMADLAAPLLPGPALLVESDAVTAHAGALLGAPGVIVIAGTGSIALGIDATGRRATAGGWGYFLGDEGSAYWIGHQALQLACRAADGRDPPTALVQALPHHLGLADLQAVHAAIYAGRLDRPAIAGLAMAVDRAAADGDQTARQLLIAAGRELARAALAVVRQLDLGGGPVAPVGGVFRASALVRESFVQAVEAAGPGCRVVEPALPPVLGAVILGLRSLGREPDEAILARLRAAARRLETVKPG